MKKICILFLLALVGSHWTYGQTCGTPSPTRSTIYPSKINARGASAAVCVQVYFHIIRTSDGADAFLHPYLPAILSALNKAFTPHYITINEAGVDYINDTDFIQIDSRSEAIELGKVNHQSNAINFYIVQSLWQEGGRDLAGTTNTIPSNHLIIRSDQAETAFAAHELAHCFNLLHTHETSRGVEAIDGSNCQMAGDQVCDTPADPGTGFESDGFGCTYAGGGGYHPIPDNIMANVSANCLNSFTEGQGARMRQAITHDPLLQPRIGQGCIMMSRLDHLGCRPATVTLSNVGVAITRWTVSNNVRIIAQTDTSITITTTPGASGEGWLRAKLSNEIELTEEFWVGRPDVRNARIRSGGRLNQYATYGMTVSGDRYADNIEWVVPSGWGIATYGNNRSATITPTTTGPHLVRVRFVNDCGIQYRSVSVCVQGGGYFCGSLIDPNDPCANNPTGLPCLPDNPPPFSIGPNPASSVLTITQQNNAQSPKDTSKATSYLSIIGCQTKRKVSRSYCGFHSYRCILFLKRDIYSQDLWQWQQGTDS